MAKFCSKCDALLDDDAARNGVAVCPRCGVEQAVSSHGTAPPAPSVAAEPDDGCPPQIGRFRIVGTFGVGAIATVYRGRDDELHRDVAIKLMHARYLSSPRAMALFLSEGRVLASLDHPGIVPVYDLGRLSDGRGYFVVKVIAAGTLRERMQHGPLSRGDAVDIVAQAADALHHAHEHRLVHRDVKPENILLDATGRALIADFGLALREEDFGTGPEFVGTVQYMSPEQARHEGHRVDARSDIYSLGVVFFELLTGQRTFAAPSRDELLAAIANQEVRSPHELDAAIPAELERICTKALAHRAADRYATAAELAADLRRWQSVSSRAAGTAHEVALSRVVPRGLRAFGEGDASFFLDLLPGPRNHEGLPDSIAFWKERLECRDADRTFRVGLLYGPSGCGKSSLVRAGLLPRLAPSVTAIYLEATPDQTEAQLLRLLRHRFPALPANQGLAETLEQLRRGHEMPDGRKVLLVLDQFEQWLHGNSLDEQMPLVQALRQCDGARVQCLLLVRDDFWLPVSRFMQHLETPVQEGNNSALVDLFAVSHARKVLREYGQAFDRLPAAEALTAEQEQFLDQAIRDLAQDGKVIAVRLSLFAEMVKERPWIPATLEHLGGVHGTGVAFLEETFSAATAPPAHKHHQNAVRAVLRRLLPEAGTNLKGNRRSCEELRQASGYADRPQDFADVVRILDGELRLITPVADDRGSSGAGTTSAEFYQLTHDYLVPALREWLTRKQRETPRGRAELRLAERAVWWSTQPEARQLPTWSEWCRIGVYTPHGQWTEPQRAMMRAATRHHLTRAALAIVAALLLLQGWFFVRRGQEADLAALHSADLVARLRSAPIRNVPVIIEAMKPEWQTCEPRLRAALRETEFDPRQQRNVRLALLQADSEQIAPLEKEMLTARPDELLVFRDFLYPYRDQVRERLWRVVRSPNPNPGELLRAAGALARFDPDNRRWAETGISLVPVLLQQNPLELSTWLEVFRPVRRSLLQPLSRVFRQSADVGQRRLAAIVLADYAAEDAELLTDLLLDAKPEQYRLIWPTFQTHAVQAVARLQRELDGAEDAKADDEVFAEAARRRAQAAVILLQLGHDQRIWPLLRLKRDRTLRSYLIHLLAVLRTDPRLLVEQWHRQRDPGVRQGLILALGESNPARLDPGDRKKLVAEWLELYRKDPTPGLHGALDWALRRWQHEADVQAVDEALAGKPRGARSWLVNTQQQTFVVFDGPVEVPVTGKRIPRSFAVGVKDVTVGEFAHFQDAHPNYRYPDFPTAYIEGPNSPMVWLSWFDSAAYCRWLSEKEGVPEAEMCYPPLAEIKPGMKMPANYLSRTGYRLPTAAEWEFAVRAGTTTPCYFGRGQALVAQFGWYANVAAAHVHPVGSLKPNGFGLFDAYGNVWQWSQDRAFRPVEAEDREDAMPIHGEVARLVRGGSFTDQAFALSSTSFVPRKPTECHVQYGMRLARTIRP